ncbi:MAG: T9SS type A sorting domain-containing protein [Bacteroidetes bacterium]|nr:T9SS type A sorting domain-containing protein [Bacteroidota bacterium]
MRKKIILLFGLTICFVLLSINASISQTMEVKTAVKSDVSIPLRDMKPIKHPFWKKWFRELESEHEVPNKFRNITNVPIIDDAVQSNYNNNLKSTTTSTTVNFNGLTNANNTGGRTTPPDPAGDVGPNHYVQAVNSMLQIFNKTGTSLYGPVTTSTIWNGFSGNWTGHNDGDAIVLYDENANRWIISQFAVDCGSAGSYTEYELVAVSTTADPTGSYYRFAFQFDYMPDYPKLGIWNDGYYLAVNRFNTNGSGSFVGSAACVLQRSKMLTGDASAQMIYFKTETLGGSGSSAGNSCYAMLPSDCDGTFPATGTPNYFIYDDQATSELRIWALHTDWTTPANSTFTYNTKLTVAAFTELTNVSQQGTTTKLDGLGDRMMFRNQYRNFGSYESFVTCRNVTVSSAAAIRWYEYRKTGSTFSLYQQSTYAPGDGKSRWMGSIAMNALGDIGLAYSVSNSTMYPSIYFTGRLATDPINQLTISEGIIQTGTVSMTGATRWGDYSAVNVDPTDNQTFWTTQEYVGTYGGSWPWATKVASFKFPYPPKIVVSPASLAFGNVQTGTTSSTQSYTVTGTYLTADITITAPTGYTISTTSGGTYSSSVTLPQTAGNVTSTPIFVKFSPTAVQAYNVNISNTSTGATTQNVALTGAGVGIVVPTIVATPSSLAFGNISTGISSASQSYIVSGTNLTANITITAPTGYTISTTSSGTYSSSLTLTQTAGSVVSTTIYVKFLPAAIQAYNVNITNASSGATTQNVAVTGAGVAPAPSIIVAPTSLAFGSITTGIVSTAQSYTVSGTNLIADITITPPTGYSLSTSIGGTYSSSLTLTQTAGSIASTTIYVKFSPTAIQTYNTNITNASTGATNQSVAVSGTGIAPAPLIIVAPTSLAFGNIPTTTVSSAQSYTVSGTNLTTNLIITAPAGYTMSTTSGGTYTSSLSFIPSSGSVASTSIYVKFSPTAIQAYNANITNASSGATTQNVAVTGSGIAPTPLIIVIPSSLSFGNIPTGTISTAQSYTISGSNLTTDITITAPNGFTLSTISNGTFTSSLTLPQTAGNVASTLIYVKFSPTIIQAYSVNITNASIGATTQNVAVTANGIAPSPLIIVSTSSLAFGNVQIGTNSAAQTYSISGINLISDISVSAPAGYSLSTNSGGTYNNSLTLTQVGGNIASTSIYVKFSPVVIQTYNAYIANTGTGATTQNIAVTGTGIDSSLVENKIILYPNPATDGFTIELSNITPQEISIVDVSGKIVLTVDKKLLNSTKVIINKLNLAKGIYIVRIQTESKTFNEKLSIGN